MTNKVKLIFGLCILLVKSTFGQINNPSFDSRDVSDLDITKIERGANNTTVYFKFKAPNIYQNGGWVCVGNSFFIRDTHTKIKYKLIKSNNIPICPQKHNFQYTGQILEFNIVFEALPSSTNTIDIIEDESSKSFNFYGVLLKSGANFTSETRILKSEAKMRESDSPISNLLYTIPAGAKVKILDKIGNYFKVEFSGKIGYVNEMFFDQTPISNSSTNHSESNSSSSSTSNQDCDKINYVSPSVKPSFNEYLAGVKYAVFPGTAEFASQNMAFSALKKYLYEMGFSEIIFGSYIDLNNSNNLCDYTYVIMEWSNSVSHNNSRDISLKFISPCLNYEYNFTTTKSNSADGGIGINTYNYFYNALVKMQANRKPSYSSFHTIKLAQKQTCWSESKLISLIESKGCDNIEGIYENSGSSDKMAKYKVAVRKINGTYYLIYLSGALNSGNWKEGEIKATLLPTATPMFYKAKWIMSDKSENNNYYITFEQGFFNLLSDDNEKQMYIKMFPSSTHNIRDTPSELEGSGTGWALSSNGYIVTNYHVTFGAQSIKVRGVNGDFSKSYLAKIVIEDKNNDLAIIKIEDAGFTSLGTIPYTISSRSSDVGSTVFVLGYPLRASMGDEVKLTNGIISSKSGFQGDVTSYQISAPVQPGNSGGPLFDHKGNIIGVINAKHGAAENASYAIKASYLMNLIELMPSPPKLQTISSVNGKQLTEQVKVLKKFTYIIEIN